MHINKNAWHYKWYQWTYSIFGSKDDIPYRRTNLCQYCQRIFWTTAGFPLYLLFWIVWSIFYYAIMTPVALFFGYLPKNIYSYSFRRQLSYDPSLFDEYDGLWDWLYPWTAAVFAAIIALEYHSWANPGWRPWTIGLHSIIGTILAIIIAYSWITDDNETANLIRGWASAKKSRFCPIVEFTDEPTSTDVNEE